MGALAPCPLMGGAPSSVGRHRGEMPRPQAPQVVHCAGLTAAWVRVTQDGTPCGGETSHSGVGSEV